jgi:hypothetical protein
MGQQQLLLIILGVIIVGIAIAVGLSLFAAQNIQANKDAIINDLNNIGAHAYQFKIRPASMGGGSGSYSGPPTYAIPTKMLSNANATYSVTANTGATVTILGVSSQNAANTVTAVIDAQGVPTFTATGDFL